MVWLDLEQAFPSMAHQLIREALLHYHVSDEVAMLILAHFTNIKMRFSTGNVTTKWQSLEKGIMAGCTIAPVLFIMAMNMILKATENQCRGPVVNDETRHPSCRVYMDEVSVVTGTHWILRALEEDGELSKDEDQAIQIKKSGHGQKKSCNAKLQCAR